MFYNISYTRECEKELRGDNIFKYIDSYVLCDLDSVKERIADSYSENGHTFGEEDVQDYTAITDRDAAKTYISQHRAQYEYVGHHATGLLDRVLCVEIDDRNKPTGALYDHPEHGLIWLEMY